MSDTGASSSRLADAMPALIRTSMRFQNADEEYRVLRSVIKDGFKGGEKAFHIVDHALAASHWRRLE